MSYVGPDTSRTDHACEKCVHFGGWPGDVGMAAWCLKHRYNNALSYQGCHSWEAQPVGWVAPPDPGPTPGLSVYGSGRDGGPRIPLKREKSPPHPGYG